MAKCKYIYDGQEYDYSKLLETLQEKDINEALSILFSLDENKAEILYDKISNLNKDYSYKIVQSSIDGGHDINSGNHYTPQTYIDSANFSLNGSDPMFKLSVEEYLEVQAKIWKKRNPQLSDEQIEQKKGFVRNNWDRIAKDALDLHRIISGYKNSDESRYFSGAVLNTSYQSLYTLVEQITNKIEKEVWKKNANSKILKNLNIEAQLSNEDKKIVGHIDYCMIREDGTIDIYNIKASVDPYSEWSAVKKEKFKYELALIKRILEYNGIPSKKIRLNLIPVRLKYNDTFSDIVDIDMHNAISQDQDVRTGEYNFKKYDDDVAHFIESNATISPIDYEVYGTVNEQLHAIFPYQNIHAEGIKQSSKEWLDNHWRSIAKMSSPQKGYDIKFPGEKKAIHVSDTKIGSANEEALALVEDRAEELFNTSSAEKSIMRLVDDIRKTYSDGKTKFIPNYSSDVANVLQAQMPKYLETNGVDSDGNPKYKWVLIDNPILANAGILLFKNKDTNQLDVITISPYDVSIKKKYNGKSNLLASMIEDANSYGLTLEGTYGNIEATRTMVLLNAILPSFDFVPKLGTLKILGTKIHNKQASELDLGLFLKDFNTIISVVNDNTKDFNMKNNFKELSISGIDPVDQLIQTWKEFLNCNTSIKELDSDMVSHTEIDGTVVDGLESLKTIDAKIQKLEVIIDRVKKIGADAKTLKFTPKEIQKNLHSDDDLTRALTKIYAEAIKALNKYNGDLSLSNEEFNSIQEYMFTPQTIPNSNVRTVAYMFQRSIDTIANQMMDKYQPIREIIRKYYEDKGYTALQNSTLGNQASVYEDLYELDLEGNRTMRFKNPYDPSVSFKDGDIDRQFLKKILFEFNKIRYEMHGLTWEFSGINDPNIQDKIRDSNWLNVPLERASAATRRTNAKSGFMNFGRRILKTIMHPLDSFREFQEGLLNEADRQQLEDDISNLQAYNPFMRSELENSRDNYLRDYPADYFEYNVENLIIDFMEKHIQSVEYNKMLTRTKGVLLALKLKGETEGDDKNVQHTIKTIEDFLSVAVFNHSIMEESSQKLEAIMAPLRRAVSNCYIAANPAAAVRDTIQGLLENTIRALNHFQTKINPSDVAFGYKEVITEGPTNVMSITKLNQLNLKFRISNLDVARISEGQKTGRGGLANIDEMAYQTLRRPDYINRMVLLVAQMHQDGCYDAYQLEGEVLKYNWKLDKRFEIYAQGKTNDPKYGEQRAKYLSLLRIFNKERGLQLKEGDDLPDAYSSQEVATIKQVSDSIYGSYNASTKAKYENIALGRNFAFFSTWMNGMVNTYAMKPQLSANEYEWKQMTSDNGEKLYFAADGVTLVPESSELAIKDQPAMELVPVMVQGVYYTLNRSFHTLFGKNGGWNSFKSEIWSNERNRRNYYKLGSDMLVAGILAALFSMFLTPAYNKHKKEDNGKNVIINGITELLYKGTSNAYDGFKGPFAMLSYLGNNTNPATYKLQSKVINDTYSFLFGDKTVGQLTSGSFALPRSFADSYKMWVRDNS